MRVLLLFIPFLFLVSCDSEDPILENPDPIKPPVEEPFTLKNAPYPVGFAVNFTLFKQDDSFRKIVLGEASSFTAESEMKMKALHPEPNKYYWNDADYVVEISQANKTRIHGHTLVWHTGTPDWVLQFSGDRNDWIALMRDYIYTVVGRYKGKIKSWDVVNEAIDNDGNYRNTIWYQKIGPEYIELAFKFAHEADPEALLFYNDYGTDYLTAKSAAILEMVKSLQEKEIPINGVGLQMHIHIFTLQKDIARAINEIADCNLLVHVAELDISINTKTHQVTELTDELELIQKGKYKEVAEALSSIRPELIYGLTIWGIDDAHSWQLHLPEKDIDWPLLYNKHYEKKMAYFGLQEVFENK